MSPAGFSGWHELVAVGLFRVGDKAAIDDMSGERDVTPLCPRPAFWMARVGGGGLCRVGDKAALDDMGGERDFRPLCPRPAFWGGTSWWRWGFFALGTKLRSMTWVVNETSGRYVPGRLFWGARVGGGGAFSRWGQSCDR